MSKFNRPKQFSEANDQGNKPEPPVRKFKRRSEGTLIDIQGQRQERKKAKKFKRIKDIDKIVTPDILNVLKPKERAFVTEFVKDFNGSAAARRAGFAEVSAGVYACELLKNPKILEAINQYEKGLSTRFISYKERILKELSILAYSDITDYLNPNGTFRITNLKDLPPQVTRAIKKFKVKTTISGGNTYQEVDFELYDKASALVNMGKEIYMFTDRKELTGKDGTPLVPTSTQVVFDFNGAEEEGCE